jgi:2-oxoisovalerate dehydrogenase E1 component
LIRHNVLRPEEVESFRDSIKCEVDQAAAEADSYAPPSTSDLLANIYSVEASPEEIEPNYVSEKPVTMIEAINHGLSEEMERNPQS